MAPACWLCGSEKGSENRQRPLHTFLSGRKLFSSSRLDARQFSFSLYATAPFQGAIPELEIRENESISPSVGSLRGTAGDSRSFFH